MKDLFKSRKFGLAVTGALSSILTAYFFKDNPELAFKMSASIMSLFGLTVVGQAHADANDEEYGKNRNKKSK